MADEMKKVKLTDDELDAVVGGFADDTRRLCKALKSNDDLYGKMNKLQMEALDRILKGSGDVDDDDAKTVIKFLQDNTGIKGMSMNNMFPLSGYTKDGGMDTTQIIRYVRLYGY